MPPGVLIARGEDTAKRMREQVDAVYRAESRRVFATLIRLLGDFDLAEEALHDAFRAALEQWPRAGMRMRIVFSNRLFATPRLYRGTCGRSITRNRGSQTVCS